MAETPRQNRTRQTETEFRPHDRYPRLNANAGKDEVPPTPRRRPVARRSSAGTPRPGKPQAFIRLDSTVATPRLSTRFNGKALARTGRLVSLLILVALIGAGVWVLTSNTFHVSRVEVTGSRSLDASKVLQMTGADKQNIFFLDEAAITRKLEALPYVLTAQVSKEFPDGLSVQITERQSVLDWKFGTTNYLVDGDGIVLDTYADKDLPQDAKAFPVIQSLDSRSLQIGDRVDAVAVRSAQTIQSQLTAAKLKITAVQYSPTTGLLVLGTTGPLNWKALVGTDAELDKKINILKGLLADTTLKWSYVDLRFVNKPVIQ